MPNRATWTDPQSGRELTAEIDGWRIDGGWLVLDCPPDPGMGIRERSTLLIPPAVTVRITDHT